MQQLQSLVAYANALCQPGVVEPRLFDLPDHFESTCLDPPPQGLGLQRCDLTALILHSEPGQGLRQTEPVLLGPRAGLHLFWDRYRYALGPHVWGAPEAPVVIDCEWRGPPPDLGAPVQVVSRRGCDLQPLDLRDPAKLRRIESFLWADQTDRHVLLRAAAAALPDEGAPLEQCGAADFLARELEAPRPGVATVLFHSSMWWYLSESERAAVAQTLESAGDRSDTEAPLFWLRSEAPNLQYVEIRLGSWPGGEDRLLARAHHHGRWVEWLDED